MCSSPGDADRHRIAAGVEDVDRGVGDRATDRRCGRSPGVDALDASTRSWSRSGRTCSRARAARSAAGRRDRAAAPRRRRGSSSAGAPRQPASISSRQVAGVACMHGRAARRRSARPAAAGSAAVSRSAMITLAAADQRQEELERGDVERERRHGEQQIVRARSPGVALHRGQEVDQRAMRNLHALRLAGRAEV